ncbi:MAG: amidophosphoribosyltransferase [Candidatus Cloacimonetes bacterium]|jgi:amidophosphoribosyltransferase|nr:amidophosphoribosyltransferase [Candidatus Cloacimonadota bacterium]MBT6993780.1 amidophosphoribosyltransferase [Candidatus Cloacimonadota bacterium]MBT7469859.1 amidophosphoribosyltransferase [Candidatus Cloacimonadota bacterium]
MCGIIGIFGNKEAPKLAVLGLFAEQHRGQESCGLAVTDGKNVRIRKKMGLVKQVFYPEKMKQFKGEIAIGHVRYPTRGSSDVYNSQPHLVETFAGSSYILASNGDLINYDEKRQELEECGVYFNSSNDGELLLKFLVFQIEKKNKTIIEAIKILMKEIKGAFSTTFTNGREMYCFRDPHAFRPMIYCELTDGAFAVASESCALDILKPKWQKEVKPAEILVVSKNGITSIQNNPKDFRDVNSEKHCIFEHIYFSRPDSFIFDENVYQVREKIGAMLAIDDEVSLDVVVPVPDSANFIALGYAKQKKIPFEMGLIRNHYVGRTFIKPEQTVRDESVSQKFNVLPNFFNDKNVVLIDDSIVRGTTLRKIVRLIKDAGAKSVHLRIGSPPVRFSCFYGIDTPTRNELIANEKDIAEIKKYIGADSLKYISKEKLSQTVFNPQNFCYACFDGKYPI